MDGPISQLAHSILHASNLPVARSGPQHSVGKGKEGGREALCIVWYSASQYWQAAHTKRQRLASTVAEAQSDA